MTGKYFESDYEEAFISLLEQSGWEHTFGDDIHRRYDEPLLLDDLRTFLQSEYSDDESLDEDDLQIIVSRLENVSGTTDYLANRNAFMLYHDGIDYQFSDGRPSAHIDFFDWEHPERNIFRAVNQFEFHQGDENRRPDIMLFINGIPVGIVELKNPTDENTTINDAHEQITIRYRRDIPALLKYCALAVVSDGSNTRLGTVFSPYEYFYAWKKVENDDDPAKALDQVRTLIRGALSGERICSLLRDFVYYPDVSEKSNSEVEVVCRYPQFFATRKLRDHIVRHLHSRGGDGKGGHYFGATGCGKTYTMLFLARQLKLRCSADIDSPTILIIVDREDLEDQSTKLFVNSKTFLADNNVKAFDSREELEKEMRARKSGGVYITTIQKFTSSTGLLSDRTNIICFSDEAHRTQDNIGSKLKVNADDTKGEVGAFITYGFAKYLRDALPKATYVGFTGTPIDEVVHVFGAEVDRYTMRQSVDDGITVPIYYEGRMAHANLDHEKMQEIEDYYSHCADEGVTPEEINRSKKAMASLEIIIGDMDRLRRVASDIIEHWEKRLYDQPGQTQKAMVVCSNRTIAYNLYSIFNELRPEWCKPRKAMYESKVDGKMMKKLEPVAYINLVGTQGANDKKAMYDAFGDKPHRKWLDRQFKNDKSNFHIAIVVDMWITGYDCPSLTVMYNDKPLQKHTLIQTISRVNRKYPGKDYGLIVDYIGIRENMKQALKQYGSGNATDDDSIEKSLEILRNEISILREFFHGFDFKPFLDKSCRPLVRLQCLQSAVEFVLALSKPNKKSPEPKTIFLGHVRRLRKAFEICNPAGVLTEEDIAYSQAFMAISAYLRKISDSQKSAAQMNRDVEKMVEEALQFNKVETILHVGSEEDIFSDTFMHELDDVKMPNTKFQILLKMLKHAIKDYAKTNKTKAEYFSVLMEQVVTEYNDRKVEQVNKTVNGTLDKIDGMIHKKVEDLTDRLKEIFKELRTDREAFKSLGITFEEKAFYDILVDIRDRQKFEYSEDKCKDLARKIKKLIDNNDFYADWLNNYNIKAQLKNDLIKTLYIAKFPPEWDKEVYDRVIGQVENFKQHNTQMVSEPVSLKVLQMGELDKVTDDAKIQSIVDNMMNSSTTLSQLITECSHEFSGKYFGMDHRKWNHVLAEYVRSKTSYLPKNENESISYDMAAEP